jgi:hypothetical protein|tara:strand:- start:678 stop:1502 length:825 start_codon:yes stop_codon:yes gene_type:complete
MLFRCKRIRNSPWRDTIKSNKSKTTCRVVGEGMRNVLTAITFSFVAVFIVNAWGNVILEKKVGEFTPPNKNIFAQRMFEGVDTGTNKKTEECWVLPEEEWVGLDMDCQLFIEAYYTKDDQLFEKESNQLSKEFRNPLRFVYPISVTADRLTRYIELDMKVYGKLKCALIEKGCSDITLVTQSKKAEIIMLKDKVLRFVAMSGICGVLLPLIAMFYALGELHIKLRRQSQAEGNSKPTITQSVIVANEQYVMFYAAVYGGLINVFSWVAIAATLD